MKKHVYASLGALCGLIAVVFFVLFVITLIPVGFDGVRAAEPITVSSAPTDATGSTYQVQVRGILVNEGEEIRVEKILLLVSGAGGSDTVVLDGRVLYTRMDAELFYEWESDIPFDTVDGVYLIADGEEKRLENTESEMLGIDTLVTAVLVLVLGMIGFAFFRQSYYIHRAEELRNA